MDEDEPRIIARGEWSQDEYGDILYTPTHIRPILSDDTQLSDARPGAEQLGAEQLGDERNDLQPDGLRAIVRPRDDLSLDLDGEPDHAPDNISGYHIRPVRSGTAPGATSWLATQPPQSATATTCASAPSNTAPRARAGAAATSPIQNPSIWRPKPPTACPTMFRWPPTP